METDLAFCIPLAAVMFTYLAWLTARLLASAPERFPSTTTGIMPRRNVRGSNPF